MPARSLPAIALVFAALAFLAGAGNAAAHVSIDVGDGQYVMEIGFRDEPAFVGLPNAVFIHVERYGTGGTEPVDDLASSLTAEVSKDGQTFSPPLVPMGDGSYQAIFVPTQTGDYTFRISGMIGEAQIDESVTSSPTTFDSVQPLSTIAFPPTPSDVATQDESASARMFGIVGIALGALALIVSAAALVRAGRAAPAAAEVSRPLDPSGKLVK